MTTCNSGCIGQPVGVTTWWNSTVHLYLMQLLHNPPSGFDAADTPLISGDFISPTHYPSTLGQVGIIKVTLIGLNG